MAGPSNFLGINTGTDAERSAITQPGGISYVLAYITDTGRLWFFDGVTEGGVELALAADLGTQLAPVFPARTANFNASAGKLYHVDTTGGAITATMPSAPSAGDTIAFVDSTGEFATHGFTVSWNGKNFQGSSSSTVMSIAYSTLKIQFNGTQWVEVP